MDRKLLSKKLGIGTSTLLLMMFMLLLILLLTGCGGSEGGKPSQLADASSETAAVYKENCISCHGSELQGRIGPATNLTKVGARMSKEELVVQITKGQEDHMPAFEQRLKREEIEALAAWLSAKK
ncbi:c-type cytochrome [Paenibacillus sp. GCM10023252]|uniref:c-type cytochrome n=1 Tax=Paenibacillus sp. GCM10023252 TaxID=3252649 RepID=UPI0036087D24